MLCSRAGRRRLISAVLVLSFLHTKANATILCKNDVNSNSKTISSYSSSTTSIPSSFVILLLGQSINIRRQNQHRAEQPITNKNLHDRTSASTSSALQFWTRSDIDDNLKKRVDGMLLLDNDDDSVDVNQVEEAGVQEAGVQQKQIESILSEVSNELELDSDSSEVAVVSSTEDNLVVNTTVIQEEDMVGSTSELKQRVSSIPVGELASAFGERVVTLGLLPGKPLFMRPFKLRNEIISKVMEEIPIQEYEDIEHGHIHEHIVMEEDTQDEQESKPTSSNYDEKQSKRRRFFKRSKRRSSDKISTGPTKEELNCPIIVKNIQELQSAVLANKVPLKDIGFRFPTKGLGSDIIFGLQQNQTSVTPTETIFIRDDPVINGPLSSLLTYDAKQSTDPNSIYYQQAIELLSQHPVLSIVRERVKSKSKPGDRGEDDTSHLALVIEGGGMRGAVSAGMAAALSTLDLLDAFDSIHGSSAGAIVGAYLVSRQLCTDVYTDIMPAAGSTFASKRRGMVSFGWDWLESKLISTADEDDASTANDDSFCIVEDIFSDAGDDNATSFWCEDDVSSVERAMGEGSSSDSPLRRSYSDDHGVVFESMSFLLSKTSRGVSKPLSYGVQRLGRAFDFANSMRQYMKKRPGMNLTYVLDGVMDETHGLRPFDLAAFRANDKKQPLYVVASAVSNGGKGEMETVAFNSMEGDFFGTAPDDEEEPTSKERVSWYRRVWSLFSFVPYSLFSAARRSLSRSAQEVKPLMKDTIEAEALPPGSSAMYGFSNRRKIRKLQRPSIDKKNYDPTGRLSDEGGGKDGIFTCLEASMLVPAAAGPPLQLIRSKNRHLVEQRSRFPMFRSKKEQQKKKEINSHLAYDAFCYEPIPYRSAVEKANATHVLALRSRPDGCIVESKQHMYEKLVAPIYFTKHGMSQVSRLFATGGSQYRYLEDVMVLNEGLVQGIAMGQNISCSDNESRGVKVPPTQLYAGTDKANTFRGTEDWKQAHLLPITLPFDTPELPTLSQDKDEVMKAVRNGYAAAFDILAPIASLPFDSRTIPGDKVASILFPDGEDDIAVLDRPVKVKSSYIGEDVEEIKRRSFAAWVRGKREARNRAKDEIALHPDGLLARRQQRRNKQFSETDQFLRDDSNTLEYIETEALLAALPGFRGGRLDHIADNLLSISNEDRQEESLVK